IRVTQLDPKTGLALRPKELGAAIATARESEASDLIFHDGYYYLFVNHNSCCKGKNSEYNIRVGRSKAVIGPYLDKHGEVMAKGGGSLFLAAHAQRNGRSVLDVRPLLWSLDGWPMAGDNLGDGTYQIVSRQSENTLEVRTPTAPPPPRAAGTPPPTGPVQDVPGVPIGPPAVHLGRYLTLDNQKWTIAPAEGGFYKIVNLGSGAAIGAGTGGAVELSPYTGADGQLWQLDQVPDGGYRIRNKASGLSLTAASAGALV